MIKYLYIFIFLTSFFANAQQKGVIQGKVLDKKDNTSIPFVNVFLEGTTIGTQTNQEGSFTLKNIPIGNYRLVASMIGYTPSVLNITISDKDINIQIILSEDIKALNEVKITGSRDKVWEKQYKEFEREFLGNDFNKNEIKVLNKEVIDFTFDKQTKTFTAQANQPIIIENLKLGYRQTYILHDFEKKSNQLSFKGLGRYEIMETTNSKQKAQWEENRIVAYQGSLKHFLVSLLNNKLKEEGFKAFFLNIDSTKLVGGPMYFDFKPRDIITPTSTTNLYNLSIKKPMLVVYENERLSPQFSEIKQLSEIIFSTEGNLLDSYSIGISGRMSEKRLANSLPLDFGLTENKTITNYSNSPKLPKNLQNSINITREAINITGIQSNYLAGETIQLSTVTSEFSLKEFPPQNDSTDVILLSVPIYVEFINLESGKLLNRFILKSDEGKVDLAFPTLITLPTGNYQIRAYTNWMRNFSENSFFKQNFTIFSQNYKKEMPVSPPKVILDTLIVHIEGGHLVEKLKSKIAIETKDNLAEKISIPFCLLNSKNDTLTSSETDSNGIATFDIVPQSKENYRIIAKNKTFIFPNAQPKGTTFTVDNLSSKEKIRVFIQTNEISNDTLSLILVSNNRVVYWKSFQNNKQSLLVNIPKNNLNGKIICFLTNNEGKELCERTIEVFSNEITIDNLANDKFLLTRPLSRILFADSLLKYPKERGLTVKGRIIRLDGKEKKIRLSMVLSSIKNDTAKQNVQTFFAEAQSQFTFQNLDFFGKMKATFIAPNSKVILDTLVEIPPIHSYKLPINWQILREREILAELDKRKEKILLENIRKENENIILNEVVVTAKKTDPNAINGISPNIVLEEKRIINQPTMLGLLYMLIPPRKVRFGTGLKVFIDSQELRQDEIDNIDLDITPSNVEKILIFEETIPPMYGRATCAIVIVPRRGASKANFKSNDSFIVEGYYKN